MSAETNKTVYCTAQPTAQRFVSCNELLLLLVHVSNAWPVHGSFMIVLIVLKSFLSLDNGVR